MRPWLICACVITLYVAQPVNEPLTASAIANEWLEAAAAHEPGVEDAPLRKIRAWNADRIERALRGIEGAKPVERLNDLVERGALLHADITFLHPDRRTPARVEGWESTFIAAVAKDGDSRGTSPLDAHAYFGRAFLRAMRPPLAHQPGDARIARTRAREWEAARRNHPRMRQWFRALSAHFAALHWFADLQPHLDEARRVLDATAGTMFDTACLSEGIASAQVQRALPPRPSPSKMNTRRLSGELDALMLDEGFNLSEAERFYREAMTLDPGHAEARVRLARLLSLKGRPREALALVEPGITSEDATVRYYGLLVLADARERDGRIAEARAAYEQAVELFPLAQSPIISIIRLSRELADEAGGRLATARMAALPRAEARRDDPWWSYFDCNGRNRERELEALRGMFKAPRP